MADELALWSAWQNVHFNHSKTKVMFVHKKRLITTPILKIDDHVLEFSDNLKYLGVIIDKKLTWKNHVDSLVGKSLSIKHQITILMNRSRSNAKLKNCLYKALVEPKILYASEIWGSALSKKTYKDKVAQIQRNFLKMITSARQTASSKKLLTITGQMNITDKINFRMECYQKKKEMIQNNVSINEMNIWKKQQKLHQRRTKKYISVLLHQN